MKTTFTSISARYTHHLTYYPAAIFSNANRFQIAVFNHIKNQVKMNTLLKTNLVLSVDALSRQDEMWKLYNRYYKVDQQSFFNRFKVNDYYAIYTANKALVGFTGFRMKKVKTSKGIIQTLYIGQTVIQNDYRGKSLIPATCCWIFLKHFLTNPFTPLYVWCDALSYKPFLIFANALQQYYPSPKEATPDHVIELRNELGAHYYKDRYDSKTGTVRKAFNAITDKTSIITEAHLAKPDIRFYTKKNPNFRQGHGLVIMAPITLNNFLSLIRKCIKRRINTK